MLWAGLLILAIAGGISSCFGLLSRSNSGVVHRGASFRLHDMESSTLTLGTVIKKFSPLFGFYAVMLAPIYGLGLFPGLGQITDFSTLRNRSPEGVIANEYILCPPSFCPKARSVPPAEYGVSADALLRTLDDIIVSSPRVSVLGPATDTPLKKEYVQRTLIFRFPDVVTVQVIPLEAGKSTLAVHSYSIYGAGDLGVNANRVKSWVEELDQRVPPIPGSKAK